MCGITGYAGWELSLADATMTLDRMCSAIRHRGPDDEGHYVAPGVGLGMRRLSIIDVAGGKQPISNETGDVQVVFNGEIYNHNALRAQLLTRGHTFTTRTDTEVIVHLYEERGSSFVDALRGMFGIAIWDEQRAALVLARDRVGIKPLYYWESPRGIAFASELRCFLALDDFPRRVSATAIARYLSLGYVPDPMSIFEGVHKLPPGCVLEWDAKHGAMIREYWTPVRPEDPHLDEASAIEELRRLLRAEVSSHLESEVPLGAFLSGGVDSSTVVALMAEQADRPVQTFSIGFEDERYNEAPDAAAVAGALGTEHTELILKPDADRIIEDVVRMFDEPFADSSALPMLLVSQLARRSVTVALSGDGGDELFGGYTRYADMRRRPELGFAALREPIGAMARLLPHAAYGRNRLLDLSRTRQGRYTATVAMPLLPREGGVGRADLEPDASFDELLGSLFDRSASRDFETQMMLVDTMSYLPGDILTKVDRTTMATSLEARVPLLGSDLVEFAVSVPSELKLRSDSGKWLLRKAVAGIIPPRSLAKPKKGFSVPLGAWFRNELSHRVDALLRADSPLYSFVDAQAVRRIVWEHRRGRRDHSSMIWRLMALDLWLGYLEAGDLGRPTSPGSMLVEAAV
ncbi:MAG TPA: asparagine synthase (glutamine-hydrolyzing) [Gemmatimonadaceae bacterium]|nr:asparagine synthase (glutamine-hydrolyzing) [Gemmatimonadaceae bacterium]